MSELGPLSAIVCVRGESFAVCGPGGDVLPGGDHGVYVRDTRVLDRFELRIDGTRPLHLSGASVGGHRGVFQSYLRPSRSTEVDPTIAVVRRRVVDGGLHEEIDVLNSGAGPVTLEVSVRVGTDFAYIFDVKHGHELDPARPEPSGDTVGFRRVGGDERVRVRMVGGEATADVLARELTLEPGGLGTVVVEVAAWDEHGEAAPGPGAAEEARAPARSVTGPPPSGPSVDCSETRFARLVRRSVADLGSLVLRDPEDETDRFVAAGSPWFLTLFGRDSLWAAFMALPYDLDLARGTLRTLARRQGTRVDHDTEEAPGKILHEIRRGSLRARGELPHVYYGSIDATPLFVILAHEAWRWGLDEPEVRALLPHVEAALTWMRDHGDPDGDGFLEYLRHGEVGLANQGWKDSADGIRFADGTIAAAPMALSEVQGYAYEAAVRGAALLDSFGRPGGDGWRAWAAAVRDRFRARFWVEDGDGPYPAVALDRDKRPVDSVASNMGHLLATGLLDPEETARVAARLTAPDMNSGWGLRTLSSRSGGYNPLSYHCGSVWPHDTAIAAWGLARAGHAAAAAELIRGLVRAAPTFNFRLPELFAGFSPDHAALPVPYPTSCRPQAWAAGGALLVTRAVLGVEADVPDGRVSLRPLTPPPFERLELCGLPLAGGTIDVVVRGGELTVEVHDAPVDVVIVGA